MKTLIYNATIVNENNSFIGAVLIDGERIARIFDRSMESARDMGELEGPVIHLNAQGCYLLPGMIDDQVHFRQPGNPLKGTIKSESLAALMGGVTTFLDMPNNQPPVTNNEALAKKYRMGREDSYANYGFYMGATNTNLNEVLQSVGPCCGLKIFMGSSTGNMLVDDPAALEAFFSGYKGVIATHCEEESIIRQNLIKARAKYGNDIPIEMHSSIRSRRACIASTQKALDLAVKYGTRLHLLHLSTAEELRLLRKAKQANPHITAEVCLPHLLFSHKDYSVYGTAIKCNPAVKTILDRDALRAALRSGLVDVIGSDHAPHTWAQKENPYTLAPSGIPMVQHSLPALLELVAQNQLTVEQLVQRMCHAPARIFGIPERGYIKEGYYADLVMIDTNKPYTVTSHNIAYACGWSPFEGHTFPASITRVIINGRTAVENGKLVVPKPIVHEVL